MKERKYQLVRHEAFTEAERLFKKGSGDIESIQVLDELLDLLQKSEADATFVQTNGQERLSDTVRRLREELGFDFCCRKVWAPDEDVTG